MHIIIPPVAPNGAAIHIGNDLPLVFIVGPCALESRAHAVETASALKEIFTSLKLPFIYKSSFDKANRSSLSGYRGMDMRDGLDVLAQVREEVGVPVLTDIHDAAQVKPAAEAVDMLQTPAFLCRQTDLILAATAAGKPVNIKKGQFLAPWEMKSVAEKAVSTGNRQISLCERGTCFGYNNLVVDMRGLDIMKGIGYPVVFDATHSVQLPGACGNSSGGQREFVPSLARAATATQIAALFMEVHPNPDAAPCDGPNMLPVTALSALLQQITAIDNIVKKG